MPRPLPRPSLRGPRATDDAPFREAVRKRGLTLSRLAAANAALKGAAICLALYPLVRPDKPQFQHKAMRPRALIYPLVPLAIPVTWWRRARPAPYPHAMDITLALPLVLDAGANAFDVYRRMENIDLAIHAVNTALVVAGLGAALAPVMPNRWSTAALATSLGIAGEALWEVAEFAALKTGEDGLELTYDNTMLDIISSSIGAAFGGLVTAAALWPRRGEVGALFGWRLIQRSRGSARRAND